MGFKLKSGNKVDFKMMGSSPVRNMKDGYYSHSFEKSPMRKDDTSNEVDPFAADEFKGYDNNSSTAKNDKKEDTNNSEQGTNAGKLPVPTVTPVEIGNDKSEENKIKTTDGSSLGDGLDDAENADERKKLMDQAKKEMYANAWQNSGIGHIVEAGKSIGRGIKNIRAKRAAKKNRENIGEKLKSSVRESKSKKAEKSTSTDPITGGIKLDTKKRKKAFRKNTVVKNGKTYDKKDLLTKKQKMAKASKMTDQELMDSYKKKHGNLKG